MARGWYRATEAAVMGTSKKQDKRRKAFHKFAPAEVVQLYFIKKRQIATNWELRSVKKKAAGYFLPRNVERVP